jgi:hypothetical protein
VECGSGERRRGEERIGEDLERNGMGEEKERRDEMVERGWEEIA